MPFGSRLRRTRRSRVQRSREDPPLMRFLLAVEGSTLASILVALRNLLTSPAHMNHMRHFLEFPSLPGGGSLNARTQSTPSPSRATLPPVQLNLGFCQIAHAKRIRSVSKTPRSRFLSTVKKPAARPKAYLQPPRSDHYHQQLPSGSSLCRRVSSRKGLTSRILSSSCQH